MHTIRYILKKGVLNDDYIIVAPKGYCLKGKYIAAVMYYTYKNEWSNNIHVRRFRTIETLKKFILKNYGQDIWNDLEIPNDTPYITKR